MASLTGARVGADRQTLDRGNPYLILNALAAASLGTSDELGITPTFPSAQAADKFAVQSWITGTGSFSVVSVDIQGSLDGIHWATLLTLTGAGATGTSPDLKFIAMEKLRYIRASVNTLTAGSGAPTYNLLVLY